MTTTALRTVELTTELLPLVDVSTVQTILDPGSYCEKEREHLIERYPEHIVEALDAAFDYDLFRDAILKAAEPLLRERVAALAEAEPTLELSLAKVGSIHRTRRSPFHKDDVLYYDLRLDVSQLGYLAEVPDFVEFLKRYRSRDGFISFMPYTPAAFLKAVAGDDVERATAQALKFLALHEEILVEQTDEIWDDSQYPIYEYVNENYGLEDFVNLDWLDDEIREEYEKLI